MIMYFSINEKNEIEAMGTTPVGDVPLAFEITSELFEELQKNLSSYKIVGGRILKDRNKQIEIAKETKKEQLSQSCKDCILSGFTCEIKGVNYLFSYDQEAQTNLTERFNLFQNEMISEIKVTAHKNGDLVRLNCDKRMFNLIYMESVKHKENCISRLHDALIPMVEYSSSIEQINNIRWDVTLVEPSEPSIIVKDDRTIDKLLEKQKIEQIKGDSEVMNLTMMLMGMGGF